MADLYDYGYWGDDEFPDVDEYLEMSDDELREETEDSKDPKIQSIRLHCGDLSEKQRWCLAEWVKYNYIY